MCNILLSATGEKLATILNIKGWEFGPSESILLITAHDHHNSDGIYLLPTQPWETLLSVEKKRWSYNLMLFWGERGEEIVYFWYLKCVSWNETCTWQCSQLFLSRIAALILSSHWDARGVRPSLALKWFCKTICVLRQRRNYQKSLNFLIHK